jgi:hypothetical protein
MSSFINTVFNTNTLAMDDLTKKELRKYIDAQIHFMKGIGASSSSCKFEHDKYTFEIKIESKSL